MPTCISHTRLLATPENRSALAALHVVLHAMTSEEPGRCPNPLFLHGPSGAGKSILLRTFETELSIADIEFSTISANDFADKSDFHAERDARLLIVEDLQHLPVRYVEPMVAIIDHRVQHEQPIIFTATDGPGRLRHRGTQLSRRLVSRLAAGLVVQIAPMQKPSRRRMLELLANETHVRVTPEILDWLAEQLGSGRQLQGAIAKLKALQRGQRAPLCLNDVQDHFAPVNGAPIYAIMERVSDCFAVSPKQLISVRRSHDVLLPRQVSMYLARLLTALSLDQIGRYFGGRNHKTVQHACTKIDAAMKTDAALSSTICQLRAELS